MAIERFLNEIKNLTVNLDDLRALITQLKPLDSGVELIRLGPADGDGGYLIPDDLDGVTCCFSPGVGEKSGFELDLAQHGLKVFMADQSVDGPAENHPNFTFEKTFLSSYCDPENGMTTLEDWYQRTVGNADHDSILQMDIEGAEYQVINSLSEGFLAKFRIIIVEFHELYYFFIERRQKRMIKAFQTLLQTHAVVHLHPNNAGVYISHQGAAIPQTMEFTFYRRDRFTPTDVWATNFPHPLDRDNVPHRPSLPLCPFWYG